MGLTGRNSFVRKLIYEMAERSMASRIEMIGGEPATFKYVDIERISTDRYVERVRPRSSAVHRVTGAE